MKGDGSMQEKKLSCWQFKKCGREKNDSCPAIAMKMQNRCWRIAGTLCGGEVQGEFAEKIEDCRLCDYYKYMRT